MELSGSRGSQHDLRAAWHVPPILRPWQRAACSDMQQRGRLQFVSLPTRLPGLQLGALKWASNFKTITRCAVT